jgi:hypothetical protein
MQLGEKEFFAEIARRLERWRDKQLDKKASRSVRCLPVEKEIPMTAKTWIWMKLVVFLCLMLAGTAGATTYTLTVNTNGSGTVNRNPSNSSYPSGVTVTVTATPSTGWYFSGWSGDVIGTLNPTNVTMNSNMVITGNFLAFPTYTLVLATNGQGTISLNPGGGIYLSNTTVIVTATPSPGWIFVSWSGSTNSSTNPLSITMNTNNSLTGTFAQLPAFQEQPQNVTNGPGGTVDFTSQAVGTPPVSYQWFFINNSLANATNSELTITNLTLANAGNYQVVAANYYGSVTSSVAALVLTNVSRSSNVVSVSSEAALRAAIQQGGWISITCNGTITLTNTINITNDVILDATGVSFALSGGNVLQLFYVAPGAMLSATNVVLEDGAVTVTNTNTPADGGAIYNDGGIVTLVSCTLTNNNAQSMEAGGLARGGAVFNNRGTLTLEACSVSDNSVDGGGPDTSINIPHIGGLGFGGAIFATNGSVTIANCLFNSNLCTAEGGLNGECVGGAAFLAANSVLISESTFTNNRAWGGSPADNEGLPPSAQAYGGALATISGTVVIDLSQFANNSAVGGPAAMDSGGASGFGGAVYSTCALTVESSSFSGNWALPSSTFSTPGGYGGGLFNAGEAILDRCSIYSNYVEGGSPGPPGGFERANGGDGLGGGIFNAGAMAITNCTIALNTALAGSGTGDPPPPAINGAALGGGLYNSTNANCTLMNDTIVSNYCIAIGPPLLGTNGFAAGVQIANTNGTLQLINTIIAYGGTNGNAFGPITDLGFNISSDGSANFQSGSSYNFTDPLLGPLANYGGPTLCMALLSNSPAIDNADPSDFPSTDQRGFVRPIGNGPDMGAYEYGSYQPIILYLNTASTASNVLLSFTASLPGSYRLQASTNLSTWTDLNTNGPFSSSTNISQTIDMQGLNLRFFRLLVQ